MKQYYVAVMACTYGYAIVEAENEDEAYQIAHSADINDMFEETECYNLHECYEINNKEEQYDLPRLRQTKTGYEVVKEEN